jgi:hypothetical protein
VQAANLSSLPEQNNGEHSTPAMLSGTWSVTEDELAVLAFPSG